MLRYIIFKTKMFISTSTTMSPHRVLINFFQWKSWSLPQHKFQMQEHEKRQQYISLSKKLNTSEFCETNLNYFYLFWKCLIMQNLTAVPNFHSLGVLGKVFLVNSVKIKTWDRSESTSVSKRRGSTSFFKEIPKI